MVKRNLLLCVFIELGVVIAPTGGFSGEIVPYLDPSYCNTTEYFNPYLLKCSSCKSSLHQQPTSDRLSCVCDSTSKIIKTDINGFPECEPCPSDEIPTADHRDCIACNNSSLTKKNLTICEQCPANSIKIERERNGTLRDSVDCLKCSNNTEPSNNGDICLPCSFNLVYTGGGNCSCPVKTHELLNGVCIPRGSMLGGWPDDRSSYLVEYESGVKIYSNFFKRHLRSSIYLCLNKNRTSCQILANMCTMVMFREDYKSTPCKLFQDAKHIPTLESNTLPWLYYGEGDAQSVLSRRKIPTEYSLDARSQTNSLNFTAVRFTPEGKFKGISTASGSFLQLCPGTWSLLDSALRIGVWYRTSCHIPAQQLVSLRETEFIDLYLQYWEGKESHLYAVPVLVLNMKPGRSNNNRGDDKSQWQLVRRFFFIDKVSGIKYETNKERENVEENASIVRYIQSCTIKVAIQGQEEEGKIYPPLLVLKYGEITRDEIMQNVQVDISFTVEYELESNMKHAMEVSVGVLCGFAILWSGIQAWSHTRRSGIVGIDMLTMFKLVIFLCANIANAFLIVAVSASLHKFIFYKGQSVVQVLLPNNVEENLVRTFIIVAFSLKIVEVLHLLWMQINVDIFFIDWERPRARNMPLRPRSILTNASHDTVEQPVSIWRTYFVANEWNEIQTKRKVSTTLHLTATTFVLVVAGVQHWATSDPEVHTSPPEYLAQSPPSVVCRLAIGFMVFITLYFFQWLLVVTVYERFIKNCIQEFVDICSMANISVFILALENYGFYIHGRSAHGFADTDMKTILEQLQREEDDLCGHRGLVAGNDHQTFQMSIPTQLRTYYRKVMAPISSITQITKRLSMASTGGLRSKMATGNVERSVLAYHTMNKFLAAFLEHALKDLDYEVREKAFLESLLDIEFTEDADRGVLYTDNGHSFDNVLFYGNEFILASFDVALFLFVEILCQDFLLAAIVTGLVAKMVAALRNAGGKSNLAKKTLIDDRFLI